VRIRVYSVCLLLFYARNRLFVSFGYQSQCESTLDISRTSTAAAVLNF